MYLFSLRTFRSTQEKGSNMNKRLKKKKQPRHKSLWQWHMYRENEERFYRIAKLCLSSVYGKCVADDPSHPFADDIMMGGD